MSTPELPALTPKQGNVLRVVARYTAEYQRGPTRLELSGLLGIGAKSNPAYILKPLWKKGMLINSPKKHRSVMLTDLGRAWVQNDTAAMLKAVERLELPQ